MATELNYHHRFRKTDYETRMSCEKCEAFYNIEIADRLGIPDMGLCKPEIIRDNINGD